MPIYKEFVECLNRPWALIRVVRALQVTIVTSVVISLPQYSAPFSKTQYGQGMHYTCMFVTPSSFPFSFSSLRHKLQYLHLRQPHVLGTLNVNWRCHRFVANLKTVISSSVSLLVNWPPFDLGVLWVVAVADIFFPWRKTVWLYGTRPLWFLEIILNFCKYNCIRGWR